MHTHTARQEANKSFSLLRDGNDCQCPKIVFPMPQQQGHLGPTVMVPIRLTCSTVCPFAQLIDLGDRGIKVKKYVISCEGQNQEIILSEVKMQDPKNPSKIVPLGTK